MSEAFVGFDSAWSGKNGGIAWASFRGSRLQDFGEPKPANFEEAACIIETLRAEHRYVLIALDQPTLVPNETGSRPVERVAASLVSTLKSGIQYANRGREKLFGAYAPIWEFLERLGTRENPPGRTHSDPWTASDRSLSRTCPPRPGTRHHGAQACGALQPEEPEELLTR